MPPLAMASVRPSASSSSSCGPMPWVGNSPMRVKAAAGVVDADHAGGVVEIVLGRVEQRAVGREDAMAEEMPARRCSAIGQRLARCRYGRRRRRRCRAAARRPPSGRDDRIEGDVVAAIGQVDGDAGSCRLRTASPRHRRRRVAGRRWRRRRRRQACSAQAAGASDGGEAGARRLAGNRRRSISGVMHRQSPSSEEKPAVRPSAPDSRLPNMFRQAGRDEAEIGELAALVPGRQAPRRSARRQSWRALGGVGELEIDRTRAIQRASAGSASPKLRGLEQRFACRQDCRPATAIVLPSARRAPASACRPPGPRRGSRRAARRGPFPAR